MTANKSSDKQKETPGTKKIVFALSGKPSMDGIFLSKRITTKKKVTNVIPTKKDNQGTSIKTKKEKKSVNKEIATKRRQR